MTPSPPLLAEPAGPAPSDVLALLRQAAHRLRSRPFVPHPLIKQGDIQTIGALLWPARVRGRDQSGDEMRLFEVDHDTQVLARCRWQARPADHTTLVMWHGMEGSTSSAYMLSIADKAFGVGFNVVRVNIRNCGGTEHLTPTLYHAGLTSDLRAVIGELIERDRLPRLLVAGFSLGGSLVLKLAGEYGANPPPQLRAVCAVSPSVDLRASVDLISQRRNWIYHQDFLYHLKHRIKVKQALFPKLYNSEGLNRIRVIEQFDDRFVAPGFGFAGANDYYTRASALPHLGRIRIPTLIIHAEDDPFIPFAPLRNPSIADHPYVLLLSTERGGHVAFISAFVDHEDRFWAENRVVEFCELVGSYLTDVN